MLTYKQKHNQREDSWWRCLLGCANTNRKAKFDHLRLFPDTIALLLYLGSLASTFVVILFSVLNRKPYIVPFANFIHLA